MRPSSVTARILLAYRSRYAQLACFPQHAANSAGEYAARSIVPCSRVINYATQRSATLNVQEVRCRKWSAVSYKSGRAKAINASFKLLSITRLLIFDSYGVLLLTCIGYLKPRCLMSGLNSSCALSHLSYR